MKALCVVRNFEHVEITKTSIDFQYRNTGHQEQLILIRNFNKVKLPSTSKNSSETKLM